MPSASKVFSMTRDMNLIKGQGAQVAWLHMKRFQDDCPKYFRVNVHPPAWGSLQQKAIGVLRAHGRPIPAALSAPAVLPSGGSS